MTLSIEQLRANWKQEEKTSRPSNYYPFFAMKEGLRAIVRFLPDANPDNPLGFLVEKYMHTLSINGEKKSVPCLKMYGEDCHICTVSNSFYKENDKINGKKYWRKKQHIGQVLVVEDPLPPDQDTNENHEGKVRFIALGYQLFNVVKDAFESGELDEVPYAYQGGTNFIIKKTNQGEHASYVVGTKFDHKASDLDEDTIAMVQDQIIDLSTLLPQHPGIEKVESMLEAALTGSEYSDTSDSSSRTETPSEPAKTSTLTSSAVKEAAKETVEESSEEYDAEADEILAAIRNRRSQKNS